MIYWGLAFLVVVGFGSSPHPLSTFSSQKARPATHKETEKERQFVDLLKQTNRYRLLASYEATVARLCCPCNVTN
jgi:hypothetical protein